MIYGYARVSTDGQSVDAQVEQLRGAGAEKVFRETASGARTDRAGLRQLLGRLGKGDVLMVTRLDRLARSTRDLLNTLAAVAVREAGFRSLGDTWADTTTAHGRLMLTVLGGLAEFERELIRSRTGEGRERAKARGVKMGRKPKLTPVDRRGCRPARPRRNGAGYRSDLQRQSQYDFEAADQGRLTCNLMVRQGEALMPIRREYRWFYPIDWPQLSAAIRFGRAKGRCEHCRRPHGRFYDQSRISDRPPRSQSEQQQDAQSRSLLSTLPHVA